jgi:multiple sugar transport system substrate-binding protein
MRARRTATVAVLAAATLLAAACARGDSAGDSGDAPADGDPITLEFQSLAFQTGAVESTQAIVDAWNAENPDVQVELVQGDWNSVNDQLLTAFEGGTAPDVFHYESGPLRDFHERGSVLDLGDYLSDDIKSDIREGAWDTVTYDDAVTGVPFLQESQVIFANTTLLDAAGVELPTVDDPWTWDEFADVTQQLTTDGAYGTAFPLKSPANRILNLSMAYDGAYFETDDGISTAVFGEGEGEVPQRIHDMIYADRTASPEAVGLSSADALPGFFAGQYATLPGAIWVRQQIQEQAPEGFEWVTLPPLEGTSQTQGAVSQTLSVSADSDHPEEAVAFIEFALNAENQVELAAGDWLLPTSQEAVQAEELNTPELGWDVAASTADDLQMAPFQQVKGFEEWKSKVANPALQEYFSDQISLEELGSRLTGEGQDILDRYDR